MTLAVLDRARRLKEVVPAELRALPQWLVWRAEERKGRLTKVPYEPWAKRRLLARCNDPSTWGSFGVAITVMELCNYDGLMFALSEADPYVFVDLDHCRRADTGEVQSWAYDIVLKLDSYTEISPSGTGIHVFVRGTLPAGGRHYPNLEMYDRLRFATVTGERLVLLP